MKRTAPLRITADLCFYFSILCIARKLSPWTTSMAIFTALAFFAAVLAIRVEAWPLRLLLGLLPGAAFYFAPLKLLLFFPALGWLYFLLIVSFGGFHEGVFEYRARYRIMLIIGLFFLAAHLANMAIYRGLMLSPEGLVFLFLFMTLGVIALRQMQMGALMDARWRLSNAATVFIVPLLAIGLAFLLFWLVKASLPVWKAILAPIANGIVWFIMLFYRPEADAVPTAPPAPSATPHASLANGGIPNSSGQFMEDKTIGEILPRLFSGDVITPLAYILAALLLLGALWLIVSLLRRGAAREQQELYYEDADLPGAPQRLLRKRSAAERSNARRVRRLYRDYLTLQRRRGSEVRRDSTSQDVLSQTAGGEADETLRRIYIAARYRGEISDEDVREAERCFEEIRKQGQEE